MLSGVPIRRHFSETVVPATANLIQVGFGRYLIARFLCHDYFSAITFSRKILRSVQDAGTRSCVLYKTQEHDPASCTRRRITILRLVVNAGTRSCVLLRTQEHNPATCCERRNTVLRLVENVGTRTCHLFRTLHLTCHLFEARSSALLLLMIDLNAGFKKKLYRGPR